MAGLFGGPLTAGIAVVITGAYRALLAGAGVWAGLATIVGCTLVGLAFRHFWKGPPYRLDLLRLYLVGVAAHMVMIACQLAFLPRDKALVTVEDVWLPVMLIYPVATVFMGTLLQLEDRRWHAERKLVENQELLVQSQSIGRVGSWELDLEHNQLRWSDEVYRIFGVDPGSFGGTYEAFLELVHPDDREAVNEAYAQSVAEGRDGYEIEHRIVRPDTGETRFVHERCTHVKDAKGRVVRSIGFVQDITRRKQGETELQQARQFAESLVQTANVIFVQLDRDGKVVNLNKAAEEITGYTLKEMKGKSWFETLVPKERYPEVWEMFARATDSGAIPQSFENPIVTKTGEEREIVWQNSLLLDDGKVI
ncbi:MAG: PAS domain-containing protein, partial [Anaerolineae bacterium]